MASESCEFVRSSHFGPARVLVEDADGPGGTVEHNLAAQGYDVLVCRGPHAGHRCDLLAHGRCALAAQADVVYTRLDWDDGNSCRVLDALRQHHPDTPVVVELPHGAQWPPPHALDNRELVWSRSEQATVVTTIERALTGPPQ